MLFVLLRNKLDLWSTIPVMHNLGILKGSGTFLSKENALLIYCLELLTKNT